jgi:drug/metabolite transporter (DMT)-like permease
LQPISKEDTVTKIVYNHKVFAGAMAICLAAALWGLDGIVLTPQLYRLDISLVVFVLHAFPFVLMNIFLFREYKYLPQFSKSDMLTLFLISLLGGAIGTMAIVKALFLVNFKALTVVVLLQKLQPVFAITLAAILLKEKLQKNFLLWAGIAVLAGYFLTFGFQTPDFSTGNNTALAALFSLLAAAAFGSSTVLSKKILFKYSPFTATFYRYGITAFIMLALILINSKIGGISHVNSHEWMIFVIIGLTTGSGAIFLYYVGLIRVRAMLATIFELCFPITAIILDYFVNGKILTPVQWISAIIMIAAILKLSIQKPESE